MTRDARVFVRVVDVAPERLAPLGPPSRSDVQLDGLIDGDERSEAVAVARWNARGLGLSVRRARDDVDEVIASARPGARVRGLVYVPRQMHVRARGHPASRVPLVVEPSLDEGVVGHHHDDVRAITGERVGELSIAHPERGLVGPEDALVCREQGRVEPAQTNRPGHYDLDPRPEEPRSRRDGVASTRGCAALGEGEVVLLTLLEVRARRLVREHVVERRTASTHALESASPRAETCRPCAARRGCRGRRTRRRA